MESKRTELQRPTTLRTSIHPRSTLEIFYYLFAQTSLLISFKLVPNNILGMKGLKGSSLLALITTFLKQRVSNHTIQNRKPLQSFVLCRRHVVGHILGLITHRCPNHPHVQPTSDNRRCMNNYDLNLLCGQLGCFFCIIGLPWPLAFFLLLHSAFLVFLF